MTQRPAFIRIRRAELLQEMKRAEHRLDRARELLADENRFQPRDVQMASDQLTLAINHLASGKDIALRLFAFVVAEHNSEKVS